MWPIVHQLLRGLRRVTPLPRRAVLAAAAEHDPRTNLPWRVLREPIRVAQGRRHRQPPAHHHVGKPRPLPPPSSADEPHPPAVADASATARPNPTPPPESTPARSGHAPAAAQS